MKLYLIPAGNLTKGLDFALIRELEETRKAVQEAKALFALNTGRDTTRHVTVIPIDRSKLNSDNQSTLAVPTGVYIQNDESIVNERVQLFGGGGSRLNGDNVQKTSGNRLQDPTFAIGQESDTESDSPTTYKESIYSKMGGSRLICCWIGRYFVSCTKMTNI